MNAWRQHGLRIAALTASCAALIACSGPDVPRHTLDPAAEPAPQVTLTLLHINDHHSRLDESPFSLPGKLVERSGTIQTTIGGFARVATAMRELSPPQGPVLRIHSGDALTGDLYYSMTQGEADARLMNVVCFDTFTLGNHEFDHGDAGLKFFLDLLKDDDCAPAVLSANVRFGPNSPMHPTRAGVNVQRSAILERDGLRIGVVGATIAEKTQHSSRPDPGTRFENERATVQAEIDALRAQGVEHIVLQSHIGYRQDIELARSLNGVDVIVGGDSHSLLGPPTLRRYGLTPEGPYPTVTTDSEGRTVCIVQAWQHALVVGRLDVGFDAQGNVLSCRGAPQLLMGEQYTRRGKPLDLAARQTLEDVFRDSGVFRVTEPDARAIEVLAPFKDAKLAFGRQTVAQALDNLCLRRIPGKRFDSVRSTLGDACNADPHVIAHGGDAQQWVAHAFLMEGRRYFDTDFSLINGGLVRTDIPAGPVSSETVYGALPFQNSLVRLTIRGSEIHDMLEELVETMFQRRSSGGYPYSSGLSWHLDLNQPKGQRFSNLMRVSDDGSRRPIDPDAYYHMVTTNYLADGSDGYGKLATIDRSRRLDVGLSDAEVVLAYLRGMGDTLPALSRRPTAHYSTQHFVDLR